MYSSGVLRIHIVWNHHHHPSPEFFSSCKTETLIIKQELLILPFPTAPRNHYSTFYLCDF